MSAKNDRIPTTLPPPRYRALGHLIPAWTEPPRVDLRQGGEVSPVEQDRPCDAEEVEAWIAGVDPITTWVTVEMPAGLTSYEVLVVRDEHNSEIGAVLVLDCEPRGRHWSVAQFNMIDFNPVLRDGDPEALATAAVERLRAEEECTCGSTRLLEGVLEQHVHELRDILTRERACSASPVARLIAQTVREAATSAGVAVASPQLARWILRGLYEGCDGWNSPTKTFSTRSKSIRTTSSS